MKSKKKRACITNPQPATPAGWQFTATAPLDPRYLAPADHAYPAPTDPPGRAYHVEPWVVGHPRPAAEIA